MGSLHEVILTASFLTAVLATLALATSDPMANLCEPICWEENALCARRRAKPRAYRKCRHGCWEIVAPCHLMCADHAFSVLDACEPHCRAAQSEDVDCEWSCYINAMMTIKGRLLPPDYLTFLLPQWQRRLNAEH